VRDAVLTDGTYRTNTADKEHSIRQLFVHISGMGYDAIERDARIKKDDTRWKFPVLVGQSIDD
jgi:hypothetical protein